VSARRKLILVSNRGPLAFTRDANGARIGRRGAGGLVTALTPLVSHHDVTWIASALSDEDRAVAAEGAVEETARNGSSYRLRLIAHRPSAYDLYYNVVANPALWFIQHGLWGLKHNPGHDIGCAWEEGYVAVNQAFADAVLEELEREPAATVFFHDYHLYVAPALVRAQRPEATLAHFTHIPWVDAEAWSVLPAPIVTAVHTGLLANDVVGFHTGRWRSAFLSACSSLGLDPGGALVTAHPISIDPDEFTGLARGKSVLARERELVASRPETMILRVDRTDPSKNVVRGLEAFGLLLERRPDLRGRVGMLALLDPSRQEIPEYVEELQRIIAAGVFNSGILADPEGSPFFDYSQASPDIVRQVQELDAVCRSFGVTLAHAAARFPLRQDGVEAIVIGARTPGEVRAFADGLDAELPEELWPALEAVRARVFAIG